MKKTLHKILFITLIFSLFACKNSNKNISTDIVNNPMSAKESDAKNTAIIEFEKYEHAFGSVEQGERLSYSFKFKNTGKRDLIISGVSSTCGCTVADYPQQPISPKKEGSITVILDTKGLKGFQTKSIIINANTIPNQINLRVTAMVELP